LEQSEVFAQILVALNLASPRSGETNSMPCEFFTVDNKLSETLIKALWMRLHHQMSQY